MEFVCFVWISEQAVHFCLTRHQKIDIYNGGGDCLLRGTHRVLI